MLQKQLHKHRGIYTWLIHKLVFLFVLPNQSLVQYLKRSRLPTSRNPLTSFGALGPNDTITLWVAWGSRILNAFSIWNGPWGSSNEELNYKTKRRYLFRNSNKLRVRITTVCLSACLPVCLSTSLPDWPTGWLTDWPIDRPTDLLTGWLTDDRLTEWRTDGLTDRPTDGPTDSLTAQQAYQSTRQTSRQN